MLKLGEYEMWEIRIKQYFQIQDYALWEVVENGNSWVPIPVTTLESGPSTALKMIVPSTAKEKTCKKNDVKARITSPEDLNVKFLRGLPAEWDTHVVVWMNKPDFDTMGLDDLYNNFKIVEQKVKKSAGTSNDDKNLAFLTTSGASNTNHINTVKPKVSTATTKVNTASSEISITSFSDATNMALLSMRARKFYQRTGIKIIIDGSNTAGAPRSKDQRNWNQGSSSKAVRIEDASEKAMCAIDGAGFDWSDMGLSWHSQILRSVGHKEYLIGLLKTELKKVKEEKEGFEFKIAKFEKSSKDLDDLLASQ
ncbi:hypothetical protein Tco_1237954, partial [Tanacetum coccineum]